MDWTDSTDGMDGQDRGTGQMDRTDLTDWRGQNGMDDGWTMDGWTGLDETDRLDGRTVRRRDEWIGQIGQTDGTDGWDRRDRMEPSATPPTLAGDTFS